MNSKTLFVISLGGSLIFPEEIDLGFLREFKKLILKQASKGRKFILISGGGKICRKYQGALSQLGTYGHSELDWMGIYTTHTNAQLIRLMFGKFAHEEIVTNPTKKVNFSEKILLAAGWKPGWSTDMDAVILAKTYGADTVINLSNIDFLYNKDPKKFKDTKKITEISWRGLLKITGKKWRPGANVPFDPIAAQFAQKNKLRAIITNGKNLKNLEKIFNRQQFEGTSIA